MNKTNIVFNRKLYFKRGSLNTKLICDTVFSQTHASRSLRKVQLNIIVTISNTHTHILAFKIIINKKIITGILMQNIQVQNYLI